ncbi:MAG: hypothetical protein IKN63_03650 [Bacilli bacterium]|nr:hypothetical protein [Bacilli bacterium]
MKLVINYDLVNAILNVNEELTPAKIIRNNKKRWATLNVPVYLIIDTIVLRKIQSILECFIFQLGVIIPFEVIMQAVFASEDKYKIKSVNDLNQLVLDLRENLYINTDYNLLRQSELISKNYKIHLNENSIPSLLENKYILVPTYDFNGDLKNIGLLQEHEVGTNDYILSNGSPKKEIKLAYASR